MTKLLWCLTFLFNPVFINAAPHIEMDRRIAVVNLPLTITCTSEVTITTTVTFFIKPAVSKGSCLASGTCGSSISRYSVTQNRAQRTTTLTISSVNSTADTGIWFCQQEGEGDSEDLPIIQFAIPVTSVTMQEISSDNDKVSGRLGTDLTLTCVTSAGFPSSTVSWSGIPSGTTPTSTSASGLLKTTTSSVTFTLSKSDQGRTVRCSASNIDGQKSPQSNRAVLEVQYGPDANQVGITKTPDVVAVEGRDMTLTCATLTSVSPGVTFTFTYSDGSPVSGGVPWGVTGSAGNTWSRSLTFQPIRDKRMIKCVVRNTATGVQESQTIVLEVKSTTPAIQTGPTAPSTGTQERNDLDCSGGRMRIHVPQTLLPTHIVTLRDPSCKVASNGSHLLADVGVNECGTTVSFTNDSVIFTNELVATALSGTTAPTIIDYGMNMKDQRVKISCIYPRENRIDFSYVPVMKEAHFYERQYGKLSFDVSQYSDEQFSHAIPHNGLPIGVTLNTELFIDISLRHASHKGVGIMVDSCIATPTSSPADPLWYTVIKDGCPAQQDVRTFASPDVDEFRFSFLVFRFTQAPLQKAGPNLPPTSMVFIHCQVSACPSQNCTNTCNPAGSHRVRREAELENSHLVSAGPFYLKSEEERGGYNGGVVAASVSMAVVATLVAIVALVAWRRSVNKLSKHQTLDEAS